MDLFKRNPVIVEDPTPEVFICITNPDGETLPEPNWCAIKPILSFPDLVTPSLDTVVIIACPDNQSVANQVRLVAENGSTCGVSLVLVQGVTPYVPSALFESSMWGVRVVDFAEWRQEADEAAREAELARRAETGRDERRLDANARSDGTFKKVQVAAPEPQPFVEDEDAEAPVF